MLKIIANVPLFVWPLFFILLVGGLKARKANLVPLKVILLVPAVLFCWSLVGFLGKYGDDLLAIFLWTLCLGLGFSIGFSHIQRINPRCDKQKMKVEMPGSWIPLVLSMSIFFAKFSIGMMRATSPHLEDSMLFLGIELFSSLILGIFAGRGMGCFSKYISSINVQS